MDGILLWLKSVWNQIYFACSNIDVFSVIDIIIVAFLIYKAIGFFRENRAGQLVKGLIILLLAYAAAVLCNLSMVKTVLSFVIDSIIIICVVIFQPELRKILEKIGRTGIRSTMFFSGDEDEMSCAIDNISKAAGSMKETKTGALIILERTTQLGDHLESGTIIDAVCSKSLLESLFFKNSALHDGAVIIRNGKIYAAGCYLPVELSNDIDSALGTRHRAAIAVSEISDCIAVIVSEETGNISVAIDGKITRDYTVGSLKTYLLSLLIKEEEKSSKSIFKRERRSKKYMDLKDKEDKK